ncbi:hypothetical protein ACFPPD_24840 [Cohnella suwonensis]|uniref:DUF559 domain-containing protein n=1 Tax=Cohnella suwonensis TaxID=696072 RepID=A0ABW0M281_9BACL
MEFANAFADLMQSHVDKRNGERKGRLLTLNFHGEKLFAEQVWWPLKGNLDDLHPEFEITDWRGRSYYADFAWLPPGRLKLLIEIKGFNSHVRDMDRQGYCNELNRELFLQGVRYRIVSLAYDDVEKRPELCVTLLRFFLSHYESASRPTTLAVLAETEIVRFAFSLSRPLRPIDVAVHLDIDHRTAVRYLTNLANKGWLMPYRTGKGQRIGSYRLAQNAIQYFD